jgi:hypothetical protein
MRSIKPMLRYVVQQYTSWTARVEVSRNTTGRDVTATGSTKNRVANLYVKDCFHIGRYFRIHCGAMTIYTYGRVRASNTRHKLLQYEHQKF